MVAHYALGEENGQSGVCGQDISRSPIDCRSVAGRGRVTMPIKCRGCRRMVNGVFQTYCPKCKAKKEGGDRTTANDEVTVGFAIPNYMCEYYAGLYQCGRDETPHTCCREECRELRVRGMLGGIKEHKMKVHHEFVDSVCKYCGDTRKEGGA